jgi:hypothetical protein
MKYKNTRPDSPKGQVYAQFINNGEREAIAFAKTIGIGEGKVTHWIGQWSSSGKTQTKVNRVRMGSLVGVVIESGPEVSEVRWDNGLTQNCVNTWLEDADADAGDENR